MLKIQLQPNPVEKIGMKFPFSARPPAYKLYLRGSEANGNQARAHSGFKSTPIKLHSTRLHAVQVAKREQSQDLNSAPTHTDAYSLHLTLNHEALI